MGAGFGKNQKRKKRLSIQEVRRLSLDEQKKISHATQAKTQDFIVQSRLNSRDQKPMVDVSWGSKRMEMTPSEAFDHALGVVSAAIAAETDSVLFEFVTRSLGLEIEIAGLVILEFRKFREDNPKRFKAWRGQALDLLTAAESAETDEFLRHFLETIETSEDKTGTLEIEEIVSEFQELRETRRSRLKS